MAIFLGIALGLSLLLILIGYLADRAAVMAKINGGNGLPILVALVLSFLASLIVAAIAGAFAGWGMAGRVLFFTVPYHLGLGALLIWRLQSLATRVAGRPARNGRNR